MQTYLTYATDFLSQVQGDTWAWFAGLTREEWLVVLAAVTAIGFICMRGFGSRSQF